MTAPAGLSEPRGPFPTELEAQSEVAAAGVPFDLGTRAMDVDPGMLPRISSSDRPRKRRAARRSSFLYSQFRFQYSTNWPPLMGMVVVATVPIVLVYVFFQRYFVGGLSTGAVKG